ncbi:MAG: hypothetical protein J6O04_02000 [Selenomonadaceae bacterium]|nr:hypothetical protein [Selenomonadaceae bacterium]
MINSMTVYKGQQPTAEQIAELDALDNRPIDYSDIPATTLEEAGMAKKYWEIKQSESVLEFA